MGNTIISLLLPEVNATIVSSLRDGSTALLNMLRSPEIMQASEVAAIVKRELSPQMSAITSGLARMATAVVFSTGSPKDSALGDSLTHSTPTYEILKELQFAMRLQGNRLTQGMDFFHKIEFNVLEMLERERRIELEHEQNFRLYFNRLKKIQDLMTVIISDESDTSEDSPAFKQQMITYLNLVHEAQVEFEAYMASQQESELPVYGPEPSPLPVQPSPPSPSNTFATTSPAGTYGNPHAVKGIDETLSQAMSHLHEDRQPSSRPASPACLKDPPEEIPFNAECVVVAQVPDSVQAAVQLVILIDKGQVTVAQPMLEEQEEEDEAKLAEEIEMAKALSISELELDERKPASKPTPPRNDVQMDDSTPISTPVQQDPSASDNESHGLSLELNAQVEVSNLTTPQKLPADDESEATTVVSASVEPLSKPHTRASLLRWNPCLSPAPEQVSGRANTRFGGGIMGLLDRGVW
jgi:hypothetical protein